MTPKQQLLKELEDTSPSSIQSLLDFARFLKSKRPAADFMEFAGMMSDEPGMMKDIVKEAEANRRFGMEKDNEKSAN